MKNILIGVLALGLWASASASEIDFSECKELNRNIARSQEPPAIEGRSVTWQTQVGPIRCDLDEGNKVIQFVSPTVSTPRDVAIKLAQNRKVADAARSGDYSALTANTKKFLMDGLKDPESVQFRNVYLSTNESPVICGEMNAKNSYGAYVGFKRFYYMNNDMAMLEGHGVGHEIFPNMYTTMCPGVKEELNFSGAQPEKTASAGLADELKKLSDLKKDGLLSDAEFEAAKKKLLN